MEVRVSNRTDPVVVWLKSGARTCPGGDWATACWASASRSSSRGSRAGRGRSRSCCYAAAAGTSRETLGVVVVEFLTVPSTHANSWSREVDASTLGR